MFFSTNIEVSAGVGGEKRLIKVTATSWPMLMFIQGGIEEPRFRTAFDHPLLDEPYFRPNVLSCLIWPGPTSQVSIFIGICHQNEDTKKSNGDFSIDNLTVAGFTITPMKSNIESGGKVKIDIEYQPPSTSLLQVGQYVIGDTFINLKCGDFNRKVPMKLKCLINLQQKSDLTVSQPVKSHKGGGGGGGSKRKTRK